MPYGIKRKQLVWIILLPSIILDRNLEERIIMIICKNNPDEIWATCNNQYLCFDLEKKAEYKKNISDHLWWLCLPIWPPGLVTKQQAAQFHIDYQSLAYSSNYYYGCYQQTSFPCTFSWMKIAKLQWKFNWNMEHFSWLCMLA